MINTVGAAVLVLLEIDPNIVKPGWTPLLILILLGLVMVLLFRSMRRQFRRVDAHWPEDAARQSAPGEADRSATGADADDESAPRG